MPHVIEPASSGRAKCRGCGQKIDKDSLRLGERMPNPFGDGEMTLWFHPACAAHKRPEAFLEALADRDAEIREVPGAAALKAAAEAGVAHRRLPRIHGVQRAASGRARCRSCKETIAKDMWRIPLVFFEDGRFEPGGFIHVGCAGSYFETQEILDRLVNFADPPLGDDDREAVRKLLETPINRQA